MKFIRIESVAEPASFVAAEINKKLSNDKQVLWLVPGGSALEVAVLASKMIRGVDSSLHISLTDERPGKIGHDQSNWQQLKNSGFNYQSRQYYEVLNGRSEKEEVVSFDAWLDNALGRVDFSLALLGMGADGHIAGILPEVTQTTDSLTAWYEDKERQRISITPKTLLILDQVVLYAVGQDKHPMLELLASDQPSNLPLTDLRAVKDLIIYNDYLET